MNNKQLSRIVLKGFKSIRQCDLELTKLNLLIGPNGAGKSNFIGIFRLIQQLLDSKLQAYVSKQGGPDALLHFGRKHTEKLYCELYFGRNAYKFTLEPTLDNRMMFVEEKVWGEGMEGDLNMGSGHFETQVEGQNNTGDLYQYIVPAMKNWRVYHFHDTGDTALVKQRHSINDNLYLSTDARNLAAFLLLLKREFNTHYHRILKTIRLVAPFFDDFLLRPLPDNKRQIMVEWTEKGSDIPFSGHLLSDGTLRFICLATVLLQPPEFQPETILIDEPELGLHPFAINLLASLLRSTSQDRQIIISTQSIELMNSFSVNDVIVINRIGNCTHLRRPDPAALKDWLSEYSLGELWQKNLLDGGPLQ